jgi:hypothetical protein
MSAPAHLADAAIAAGAAPPSSSDELASSHVLPSSRKSQYPLETPRYASQHFGPPDCVEMLFAHLKRILRLGRLRLRGPRGAQFEFTLAATAQNLCRLAKLIARAPTAGRFICGVPCGRATSLGLQVVADGADDIFETCTHGDDPVSGSTFTTEGNLDA